VVLLVLLSVGGIGGYFVWKSMRAPTDPATPNKTSNTATTGAAAFKEVGRYWLEIAPPTANAKSLQVVPTIPVASGQVFKFHFTPTENGFLYIIGPGDKNKPTAFLGGKPNWDATGWTSNEIKQGVDASVPTGTNEKGRERWFELDKRPSTEAYTLIFSPTRLESPAFLQNAGTGYELTAVDQQELAAFREKHKNDTVTEYDSSDPSAPFVFVKAKSGSGGGNPIVLEVRIEHK
jgi:hypothetical protein